MELSIIIVNYNVKYFLEQCIHSIRKSCSGMNYETIVIDNNSVDGSQAMLEEKFPEVILIANKKNQGFSKANNQGINISQGKYILILNPDTVLEEQTMNLTLQFMNLHAEAGALGVKMINGKGKYLPESKRGIPTPKTAFYKIVGLTKLFPKSKAFARYYLGHLDSSKIQEIEVLPGAFMLIRSELLKRIGGFDEIFFMYAEDIDLSYRILKEGWKIIYYPDTTIIHYKGESTKKTSFNYVKIFYQAMLLFYQKHFVKNDYKWLAALIQFAIYLRAIISLTSSLFSKIILPVFDFSFIFLGFFIIKPFWETFKFNQTNIFPEEILLQLVPVFSGIMVLSLAFSGAYKKPIEIRKTYKGIGLAILGSLVFYSLLDEQHRFSRAMIVFVSIWGLLLIPLSRYIFNMLPIDWLKIKKTKRFLIISEKADFNYISQFLKTKFPAIEQVEFIDPTKDINFNNQIKTTSEFIKMNKINEVVFSSKALTNQNIISFIYHLSDLDISFKIASPDAIALIGSNSVIAQGALYDVRNYLITSLKNKLTKRMVDLIVSLIIIMIFPILILIRKIRIQFIQDIFQVLIGAKSWVGITHSTDKFLEHSIQIKPGIFIVSDFIHPKKIDIETIKKININYIQNYKPITDFFIIFKAFRNNGIIR